MKLILPLISVTLLLLVNALPSDATTSYLNLLKKTREKNTSLSGKSDQEVMLAMMDQYNKKVSSIAAPSSLSSSKNEKTVKMSARMPVKTVAASQPAVVPASQETNVNLAASIPVTAATDSSSQQEAKSALRPMHLRTIGLAEKHISKSGNSNSIKPLSASIPTSTHNAQSKTLAFTHDPTISFGMMNNQAAMNPSQMQAIQQQQQQHHQQQQQQQAALQMQQMQPGFAMNGFDQSSALANLMLQQQQQQLMMQNPTQQYAYGHQSLLPSNGVGVGGGSNYFQSNLFSNNPLRKGNELNKARKELLTDPKFLKDQPKLSNFLFAKYLKEVSTDDEEEEKEEVPIVKTPVRKSGKRLEKGEKKASSSSETRTPKSKVNKVEKKVEEVVNKMDEKEAEIEIAEEEVVEPPKTVETKPAEVQVKKSSSKQEQPQQQQQQQQQQQETAPVSKPEIEKKEKKEKKSGKNEEIKKLSARIVSPAPSTRYMGSPEMDDLRSYINNVRKEWTQNSAQ